MSMHWPRLFYGFKIDYPPQGIPGSCSVPDASYNAYAGSECIFRSIAPGVSQTNFLAVMLTASNLVSAKQVIDRAVAGDGTFPTQTVYLAKSSDVFRNLRYALFDNAVINTRLRGNCSVQRISSDPSYALGAAFQTSASLTPSNSAAQWTDTNAAAPQRFYHVRTSK